MTRSTSGSDRDEVSRLVAGAVALKGRLQARTDPRLNEADRAQLRELRDTIDELLSPPRPLVRRHSFVDTLLEARVARAESSALADGSMDPPPDFEGGEGDEGAMRELVERALEHNAGRRPSRPAPGAVVSAPDARPAGGGKRPDQRRVVDPRELLRDRSGPEAETHPIGAVVRGQRPNRAHTVRVTRRAPAPGYEPPSEGGGGVSDGGTGG